jgi:hypothetical protein
MYMVLLVRFCSIVVLVVKRNSNISNGETVKLKMKHLVFAITVEGGPRK